MLPVLATIGSVKIYSFGMFLFLALFFGLFWWWKLGRDENLDEKHLFDVGIGSMFLYFLFARLGYVVLNWSDFGKLSRIMAVLAYPGLVHWIGVVGVTISIVIMSRARGWKPWKVLDIFAVSLSFVLFFGMIGALLNGSNPGRELRLMSVKFPGEDTARFMVDGFGAIWYLPVFLIVSRVRKNFRFYSWYKGKKSAVSEGLAFLVFFGLSGIYYVIRSFVDDNLSYLYDGVSFMMAAGVVMIVVSLVVSYNRSGRVLQEDWERLVFKVRGGRASFSLARGDGVGKLKRNKKRRIL